MDHGLEAHVHLATTNDLSDIGGVIGLQQSNFQAFFLEVTLALGEVQGGVVRGRVPYNTQPLSNSSRT